MEVFIVSKKECPWCVRAKEFLNGLDMPYKETILGQDVMWDEETRAKYKTVPQIWIEGQHIGGYEDLVEWALSE